MQIDQHIEILRTIYTKRKQILICLFISAILGIIIAYAIPVKYKSSSFVYPINLWKYSEESPTEQLLQFMQSEQLKEAMLKRFNMGQHYRLDLEDPLFRVFFDDLYGENFQISKTEYESVNLTVWDRKADSAQIFAKGFIEELNALILSKQNEKTQEYLNLFDLELQIKKRVLDSMDIVLKNIKTEYGIIDHDYQINEFSRSYFRKLAQGTINKNDPMQKTHENFVLHGEDFRKANNKYRTVLDEYNKASLNREDKLRDLSRNFTFTTVVSDPTLPAKKSYPIRWLVVAGTMISTLIIALLYYVVLAKINWTYVFKG